MSELRYTVCFQSFAEEGLSGYNVTVPALPGCVTWGRTIDEAREMAADAIALYVESLAADGLPIPQF